LTYKKRAEGISTVNGRVIRRSDKTLEERRWNQCDGKKRKWKKIEVLFNGAFYHRHTYLLCSQTQSFF
jgi:hypothetical protein